VKAAVSASASSDTDIGRGLATGSRSDAGASDLLLARLHGNSAARLEQLEVDRHGAGEGQRRRIGRDLDCVVIGPRVSWKLADHRLRQGMEGFAERSPVGGRNGGAAGQQGGGANGQKQAHAISEGSMS
jgi:hypothetical protein